MKEKEVEGVSRRDFVKRVPFVAAAAFGGASYILCNRPDAQRWLPYKKESHLTTLGNGQKIGVITGPHGCEDCPNIIKPVMECDLFKPMGAYFLESGSDYLSSDFKESASLILENLGRATGTFHSDPVRYALENESLVVFGDTPFTRLSGEEEDKLMEISGVYTSASIFVGGSSAGFNLLLKEAPLSRRSFLKRMLAAGFGLGELAGSVGAIHFSTPELIKIAERLGYDPSSTTSRDFATSFSDLTHPEESLILPRNIVWALKCRDLYETEVVPRGQIINVGAGFSHRYFDFWAKHPDFAVDYWNFFGYGKVAEEMGGGSVDWVYSSFIYKSPSESGLYEHRRLKQLKGKAA